MYKHKRTTLFFERWEGHKFDLFLIHIYSWATKEQWDMAYEARDVATQQGWTLIKQEVEEEKYGNISTRVNPSLCFTVKLRGQKEFSHFNFLPTEVATFDHALLKCA